ncbi:hypothetical protein LTS18_012083 [Coniosporium uncinatum]|uniref:Uncharacterized protein n=1 Tax=Coniosporium uncinatum TaxID=93489 RepID=A0ACC3CXT9_9PEZI|nr:hypothetical protein LTS18_012083 [Coniosporium uncinatum]
MAVSLINNEQSKLSPKKPYDAVRLLANVQSTSALMFTMVIAFHLSSVFGAALGLDANAIMHRARLFYQHPILEFIFVYGAMIAHFASGIARRVLLNRQGRKKPWTAHSVIGYILIFMVGSHVVGNHIYPNAMGLEDVWDYRGIGYIIDTRPRFMYIVWINHVAVIGWHVFGGLNCILSGRRRAARMQRSAWVKAIYGLMVLGTVMGIGAIRRDVEGLDEELKRRYDTLLGL